MPQHPKAAIFVKTGLFKDLEKFQDLENRISQIEEDKSKGDAFEVFAEAYLATQRKHEAKEIWPLNSVPLDLLQKTGLTTNDYGIDGLYSTPIGEVNAYQVKYRANRPSLTWRELSTFIALADSPTIRSRVLITNCDDFPDLLNQRENFFCIKGADLDRLDKDALREITDWIHGSVFERCKKSPRPHQQEAINKILQEFSRANRATAVMACGTGKTLVGLWVMEALKPAKAIILMPSLALIRQTLHEWLRETSIKTFSFLCVCSDQTVSEGIDHLVIHQADLDFEVTTDTKRIRDYLDSPLQGTKVVFTTYHSAPVVGEALKDGEGFDYGVFDEAHKTTGKKDRRTGFAVTDDNILIKKRLFLTATPKRFNPYKRDDQGELEQIFSMDDKLLYGNTCFSLGFGRAVEAGIICPYEVLISVITTDMVTNALLQHGKVSVKGDSVTALQVAHQIAVRDAVVKYGVKKVFTFHSSVKAACVFTSEGPTGIKAHLPDCSAYHVNGAMASNHRERTMRDFSNSKLALMSNARCLTEGVDVPLVDMVAFLSPKKSQIDIIQAAGRAMRNAPGKEKGYILVPLLVEQQKGETIQSAVLRADFLEVWEVLQGLQEQDDVLADVIARYGMNAASEIKAVSAADHKRRIDILSTDIPLRDIEQSIIAKSLGNLITGWAQRYALAKSFFDEHMHCNAEYVEIKFKEHKELCNWLRRQRTLYKEKRLSGEKVSKLNEIGIIWDYKPHKPTKEWKEWEKNFYSLTQHKRRHGNLIPNQSRLLRWTNDMRQGLREKTLPDYQEKLLVCIGLEPAEETGEWYDNYKRIKTWWYRNKNYKILSPKVDPSLRRWAQQQRKERKDGTLIEQKIQLLNEIDFPWQQSEPAPEQEYINEWKSYYGKLKGWWETRENYFFSQMEEDIHDWAKQQCGLKRQGDLTQEQIKALDDISFPWDRY